MADDETTANTSPPPAVDATTAATTAAAAATSWFDSLGVDIGKALETAREQVVKAAEDATPAWSSAMDAVKQHAARFKEEAVHAAQSLQQVAVNATQDIEAEQARVKASSVTDLPPSSLVTLLPWETADESQSILSQVLLDQILALSHDDRTFDPLHDEEKRQFPNFKLENYVEVITRLLALDPALGKMHAKYGGKGKEEGAFWQSYFYRCACLRVGCGMGGGREARGGGVGYEIIGDPVVMPVVEGNENGGCREKVKEGKGGRKESAARLSSSGGVKESKESTSSPAKSPSGSVATKEREAAVAVAAEEKGKEEVGVEGEGGGDGDSMNLDGLNLSDDEEGGDALEGDALLELEAQIAAELGEDEE